MVKAKTFCFPISGSLSQFKKEQSEKIDEELNLFLETVNFVSITSAFRATGALTTPLFVTVIYTDKVIE